LKNVLIIASELDDRLALISQLKGKYMIESRSQIPRSVNELRDIEFDGIILSVRRRDESLDFCRKIMSSSLNVWVCIIDLEHKIQNPEEVLEKYGLLGYWGDSLSNEFSPFVARCSLGDVIIHKRESRLQRFLGILSTKRRKT